jgi:hypothetical protein
MLKKFWSKPEGRRPFGKSGCGWVDNIKMYLENRAGRRVVDLD